LFSNQQNEPGRTIVANIIDLIVNGKARALRVNDAEMPLPYALRWRQLHAHFSYGSRLSRRG
jgi:hypothetical protein